MPLTQLQKDTKRTVKEQEKLAGAKPERKPRKVKEPQDVSGQIADLSAKIDQMASRPKKERKPRAPLSDEQKQVLRERLVKAREAKVAKRSEKE